MRWARGVLGSVAFERHLLPRVTHIPDTGNRVLELAPGRRCHACKTCAKIDA